VQTEVWKQWFDNRNKKNSIIKMNTGSGKTVVGLTILQSCLNEGKGPAVYIVPDNYLVEQVCLDAEKLGINVVRDKFNEQGDCIERGEDNYLFVNKKAIFVTNIHKLVNGKSVFGMRQNGNLKIGSIIIDDVHACMDTIEQQYAVKIERNHPAYFKIIERFGQYQEVSNSQTFYDIKENIDRDNNRLIEFWVWQNCCEEIRRLIMEYRKEDDTITKFNLPLLTDNWETCNCVISAQKIEITPKFIPISKISSFNEAERRIFMSATLADDSVFVSTMGLKQKDISNIITPEKANDIGERLILFPKHLNPQINDDEIKQQLINLARNYNVVVIIPSFERLNFWEDARNQVEMQVLSSRDKNIDTGILRLKSNKFKGLTILVNKYDGIDLPDDACRILVIDGLPMMRSAYDNVIQSMNPGDKRLCRESIQKIEQGMGRGVRSNNDYCVVVLMGNKLADVIVNQDGDKFFSTATHKQYDMSRNIWDQVINENTNPSVEEIFELSNYTLGRDKDWISRSKSFLSSVEYNKSANIDRIIVACREAFDKESIHRYEEAFNIVEKEKNENKELDNRTKGLLMQLMAEYKNFSNPAKAQEILLSAQELNKSVIKPIKGITYEKLKSFSGTQGENVLKYIKDKKDKINEYLIHVDSVLDSLIFSEKSAKTFEAALMEIASIIGISSSRPENDGVEGGPDNLWAIDDLEFFIIECKNGVKPDTTTISKSDNSQLLSSIQWFENLYKGNNFKFTPIIIHKVNLFDAKASPNPNTRVMTEELLNKFKNAVRSFTRSIAKEDVNNIDDKEIQKLLNCYKLNGKAIIIEYTLPIKKR
jgi:replicative superfamily II helicase